MCGIVAALQSEAPISSQRLAAAVCTIGHRGPDHAAMWVSTDGRMALGHARLSIIGLENGDQPLANAARDVHCVVNGEFYGYQGIRDRFGIKPLFYAVRGRNVFFASEVKALIALGIEARWDGEAFFSECHQARSPHRTLFAGISAVPPGCVAIARDGRVDIRQYWDMTYPPREALDADRRSDEEIIEGFRAVFDDAVAQRLIADVEVVATAWRWRIRSRAACRFSITTSRSSSHRSRCATRSAACARSTSCAKRCATACSRKSTIDRSILSCRRPRARPTARSSRSIRTYCTRARWTRSRSSSHGQCVDSCSAWQSCRRRSEALTTALCSWS